MNASAAVLLVRRKTGLLMAGFGVDVGNVLCSFATLMQGTADGTLSNALLGLSIHILYVLLVRIDTHLYPSMRGIVCRRL